MFLWPLAISVVADATLVADGAIDAPVSVVADIVTGFAVAIVTSGQRSNIVSIKLIMTIASITETTRYNHSNNTLQSQL